MRTVTHKAATPPPQPPILEGVIYEDPGAEEDFRWFIGVVANNGYGQHATGPALVNLSTGRMYLYHVNGTLPGAMREALPGTITITVPRGN